MKFTEKYTYLGCRRYSFKDSNTGRDIKGVSVYLVNHNTEQNDDVVGFHPIKLTAPYDLFDQLYQCKSMSSVSFEMEVVLNGNNTSLRIVGIAQ